MKSLQSGDWGKKYDSAVWQAATEGNIFLSLLLPPLSAPHPSWPPSCLGELLLLHQVGVVYTRGRDVHIYGAVVYTWVGDVHMYGAFVYVELPCTFFYSGVLSKKLHCALSQIEYAQLYFFHLYAFVLNAVREVKKSCTTEVNFTVFWIVFICYW